MLSTFIFKNVRCRIQKRPRNTFKSVCKIYFYTKTKNIEKNSTLLGSVYLYSIYTE